MGLPIEKQIEIISAYKKEIHKTAERMAKVVQEAYSRIETQEHDFKLEDKEILKISNNVGKIITNLSLMAAFADRNTKIMILELMEIGGKAYILLRTPTRFQAIGMLDAWLKLVQSIIPDFTKTPFRFKISAELNAAIAKIRGLFEKGYV